jgi:hypothetical protein
MNLVKEKSILYVCRSLSRTMKNEHAYVLRAFEKRVLMRIHANMKEDYGEYALSKKQC